MRVPRTCCLALAGLLLGAAAHADTPADDAQERARIRAERSAAETTYAQQVQACNARFAVTSCVKEARAQRHAELSRLDKEQLVLDEARRTQRAAERKHAIDAKVEGEEARRREEAATGRAGSRRAASEPGSKAAPASAAAPRAARAASSAAERAEQEARARSAYEHKQAQAQAHREEVARRNAERARKANPGAPLPTPSASAVLAIPASAPAR